MTSFDKVQGSKLSLNQILNLNLSLNLSFYSYRISGPTDNTVSLYDRWKGVACGLRFRLRLRDKGKFRLMD
jgi:hypothetical protein